LRDQSSESDKAGVARGRVLLVAAALLWSTSGLFVKSPPLAAIPQEIRGPVLACFRALAAAGVLILFIRPKHVRWRPMLVPLVISFSVMNILFVTAMTRTTAAAAVFLQYTSTGWAFLFSVLFLGERVGRANLFALAMAMAGVWWIVQADWATQYYYGNLLALGSGIGYAGVLVSLRLLRGENAAWLVALCHTAAGLILLPSVLTSELRLEPLQWGLVVIFGIVQMGIPYVIFARAVRLVSAQEAALLTLIEPVANPIWVWLLWGEAVGAATWIGGALILLGLAGRYVWRE
jgi:drug/metabolite transporter, DME family